MSKSIWITAAITAAVWTLTAHAQTIREDSKLLPPDGLADARFSSSIAISNGRVAVGADKDVITNQDPGSAYLFDASTGEHLLNLIPNDGDKWDRFGASIAIDNGVVAVGAPFDSDNGTYSGSAYLFDASTGVQIAKLLPNDGEMGDRFGNSIAIDGDIVAIGARLDDDHGLSSGSVYLFDVSTGVQLAKLLPSEGATNALFGTSIDIEGGIVAIGAELEIINKVHTGSAYVFDVSTGLQLAKLLPHDGESFDHFGSSIAIENGIVAVGAYRHDSSDFDTGAAYLFDAHTGLQLSKLLASDRASGDFFGYSIDMNNGVVVVGANGANWDDDGDFGAGMAYVYDASTRQELAKFIPSDGAFGDNCGSSIAIENGVVAIGSERDDDNGSNSGSAYLFRTLLPCLADLTDDGQLDFFDVSAFLDAFAKQDPLVDHTSDGLFDFFDVSAFLDAFAQGCP